MIVDRSEANQLGSYCNFPLFRNGPIQASTMVEIGRMKWKSNLMMQGLVNDREAKGGSRMFLKFPNRMIEKRSP